MPVPWLQQPILDNEADHVTPWHKDGVTGVSNLNQPCRKHHRLRHTTGWKPVDAGTDASPGWVAPSGRRYLSEGYDWEPPWMPGAFDPHAPPDIPWDPDPPGGLPADPLPDWEKWIAS